MSDALCPRVHAKRVKFSSTGQSAMSSNAHAIARFSEAVATNPEADFKALETEVNDTLGLIVKGPETSTNSI